MAVTASASRISRDVQRNQDGDGVLSGTAWNTAAMDDEITYSFPDHASDWGNGYSEAGRGF